MSIRFQTGTPKKLLATFKQAIDEGKVVTWSYDKNGDFTHTAQQWKWLAWLRPSVVPEQRLVFSILKPKNSNITSEIYAIYHGRFVESMLVHCDSLFTEAISSAYPADNDIIS